jgi:hypothetical protein
MHIAKQLSHVFLFYLVCGSVYAQQSDSTFNPISEQIDLYQFTYKETEGVNLIDQQNGLSITINPIKSEYFNNYIGKNLNYGDYSNTIPIVKQNYMNNSYSLSSSNSKIINSLYEIGYDYNLLSYINNKVFGIKLTPTPFTGQLKVKNFQGPSVG